MVQWYTAGLAMMVLVEMYDAELKEILSYGIVQKWTLSHNLNT